MARKKIILFIVEGINDKTSLEACIKKVLNLESIHFKIVCGDLTTKFGNHPGNIASKIGEIVKQFSGTIFSPADFSQIVHLVDLDGAYVLDQNIASGSSQKNYYEEDQIVTIDVPATIDRNHRKQAVLEKMLGLKKVWRTIPYQVYYFSCNMDHVLHNKQNMTEKEKEIAALQFESAFINQPEAFVEFFHTAKFAVTGDYKESWEFIKNGTNSLHRYSNLAVYLDQQAGSDSLCKD